MTGDINVPDTLKNLKGLQSIDLSRNKLTGTFPTWLLSMPDISSIDLSYNQLSGSIPDELMKIERLRNFRITNNAFSGSVPLLVTRNYTNNYCCCPPCVYNYLEECRVEGGENSGLCWKFDPGSEVRVVFKQITF